MVFNQSMRRDARRLTRAALRPPKPFDDPFIEWLLLVNAGMQHRGNIFLFDVAVKQAPDAPFLEIGSFSGLSTNIIQYLKRKHGRQQIPLFTCDKWIFEGSDESLPTATGVSNEQISDYVQESFKRSMQSLSASDLPFTIKATSDELSRLWKEEEEITDVFGRPVRLGGPLGFCFIDGNHQEAFVERDFNLCDEHLLPGGLILFDDSTPEAIGDAYKVVKRVKGAGRYDIFAKNPNYLLRKK